jgi:hypothetical protein
MANQVPDILFQIIDNTTSNVEGVLDIDNPTDFPLALTYSIKDVQDITKSKGSFSKTFKIPATQNNNDILKSLFSDSFYNSFLFVEDKKARIWCDGSLIMEGQFKIQATTQDKVPLHYQCVIFGENYEWVNALESVNLCDLDFDAGNLFPDTPSIIPYEREDIEATWEHNFSGHIVSGVGTHVVYPLVNTGKWTHGNFAHVDDMFAAIWVRNILLTAFAGIGYQVESEFFESDWFKKLITLSPRQMWEITEDSDVATPYSWEYCTDPDTESGWKIPANYRNLSQPTNTFDGAIGFLPTPCCTGCDPDNVITAGVTFPDVKFQLLPHIDEMNEQRTWCGWWWGSFGSGANYMNGYGACLNTLDMNGSYCDTGLWIWGSEWNCVWTDPQGLVTPTQPPTSFHVEPINNVSVFQTTQTGEYSFNIEALVEMDNQYTITNVPEPVDPFNMLSGTYLENEGFFYDTAFGNSWGQVNPQSGYDEFEDFGTQYSCNLWLIRINGSTGFHEPTFLDRKTKNSTDNGWHNLFNASRASQGGALPSTNLEFKVEATNILVDIVDTDDKYYFYTEVFETLVNVWSENANGGVKYEAFCQCKYRIKDAKTWGGLTNALIDGGQISINSLLPCDTTQLEWINGLTGLFNLYWFADEGAKVIYCEPRDNFFLNTGEAIDWSDKINMGQPSESKFVYDTLNRDLCFTYEDDGSDGFVEERNDRVQQQCSLNSYSMDLGNLYKNDETQIGSEFYCPTYMFNDKVIATNSGKAPYIPVIHSEYTSIWTTTSNSDYPDKIEEFGARILLWGGLTPVFQADGSISGNAWRWGKTNPSSTPYELNDYPFAATFNNQNEDFFGSLILGGITYFPTLPFQDAEANDQNPAASPPLYPFCDGLFKVFWEKNINTILERPRIKTALFNLNAKDISEFDFRRLVYLDAGIGEGATYWIVNKIVDYKPAKNQLTKVELFQWNVAKPHKPPKAPRHKRSNFGQSRDVPNGKNYQFMIRLENNANALGVSGVDLIQSSTTPNLTLNNAVPRNPVGTPDPSRTPLQPNDGRIRTRTNKTGKSFNVGNNNEVLSDSNTIVIGNNARTGSHGGIHIINGSNTIRNQNDPIVVSSGNNKNPAFVVNHKGEFMEGGGGAIVYQDASGNFLEVYVETRNAFSINYKKLLKSR